MDKTTRYRNIIIEYLNEFANFGKPRTWGICEGDFPLSLIQRKTLTN